MQNPFDNKENESLWCNEVLVPTSPARVFAMLPPYNPSIAARAPFRARLDSVPRSRGAPGGSRVRPHRLRRFVFTDLHADLLDDAPAAVVQILVDPVFEALQDFVFEGLR